MTKPTSHPWLTALKRTFGPTSAKKISIGPQASNAKQARSSAHTPLQSRHPAGAMVMVAASVPVIIALIQPQQAPPDKQPEKTHIRDGHQREVDPARQ